MKKFTIIFYSYCFLMVILFSCEGEQDLHDQTEETDKESHELPLELIQLPEGFNITIFAKDIEGARSMVVSPSGTVFVGSRAQGKLYALPDADGDFVADEVVVVKENMDIPNGVDIKNGNLYVAEVEKIWRFDNIENTFRDNPEPALVTDRFPSDKHHGWKFIRFGPDGKLYVPVGAPCNICTRKDSVYSTITRMNEDGSGLEIFAHGVRNTLGFDWHPTTREMWFTENGTDLMGENRPPDELNHAPRAGMHFGFPWCHGYSDLHRDFIGEPCENFTPPVEILGPHVAVLGMRFYTGNMFPEKYKNAIIMAEHGSWNRVTPIGYRLTMVRLDENYQSQGYEIFADGWHQEGRDGWGRPVDVVQLKDGSLLVSDDMAGVIYRISYTKPGN